MTDRSNIEEGESLREHRKEINVIEKTLRGLYYNPERVIKMQRNFLRTFRNTILELPEKVLKVD